MLNIRMRWKRNKTSSFRGYGHFC